MRINVNGLPAKLADKTKINLNQNVWVLVVALLATGVAERYQLGMLFWPAWTLLGFSVLFVIVSMGCYTVHYCKRKKSRWAKLSEHPANGTVNDSASRMPALKSVERSRRTATA